MRAVLAVLLLSCSITRACAALAWDATTLLVNADPLEDRVEAVFRFKNAGSQPATITDTHASCGCTVPSLEKRTFAPGEVGELRVVLSIGEGMTGMQEKTVTVTTDDSGEKQVLALRVNVPGLWEVSPKFVKWEHGEERTAKAITIRALHPELAKPVSVEARDARFVTEVKPSADDPGVFIVTIQPASTDAAMFTSVLVTTDAPSEKKRHVQLYAVVR